MTLSEITAAMQDVEFRKEFGARLKLLRKQKHWSQKELANKVGIRFQQLNKYESGLNLPPVEMLILLGEALATSVDYLLSGNEREDSPLHSIRLVARLKAVETFDTQEQEVVIQLLDAMIAKHQMQVTVKSLGQ